MAMKVTRWSPDTCGCQLEYEWDDAVAPESRKHSFKGVVQRCAEHAGTPQTSELYDAVVDENTRKNYTVGDIGDALSWATEQSLERINWAFDGSRVLQISFGGGAVVMAAQKATLQAALDTRFGSGKVVVS